MRKLRILSWLFKTASASSLLFSSPLPSRGLAKNEARQRRLRKLKKIGGIAFILLAGGAGAVALYLMFSGPRMRVQPKIVPYQAQMPPMPDGAVPVSGVLPTLSQASVSLPGARKTLQAGRVYYGYYCAFCHGQAGHGDGPVGFSYVPAPTDLTLPRVAALSDGALLKSMLSGAGHEPVLDYVIKPKAYGYIIRYVRHLQASRADEDAFTPTE